MNSGNNPLKVSIDTIWKQELGAFQDRSDILSNLERSQMKAILLKSQVITLVLLNQV
jgi:hypothetical protein